MRDDGEAATVDGYRVADVHFLEHLVAAKRNVPCSNFSMLPTASTMPVTMTGLPGRARVAPVLQGGAAPNRRTLRWSYHWRTSGPSHWRNTPQNGPMPLAGDIAQAHSQPSTAAICSNVGDPA